MKVSVGTTEFMRWAGATLGITSLATATSVVLLYAVGTEFAWAIFAGLYVWLAVSILMWLGAPRYLGPAVVALPLTLLGELWIWSRAFEGMY
jgi:hypothetical protein